MWPDPGHCGSQMLIIGFQSQSIHILHLAPASTTVIYILHYYLLCFSFHFTQLYSQFYRYLQILFSGGDLFERVAAPDYKLTEEKIQIFMRQIIKGNRYGCLATFCTNVFLEQSKHTSQGKIKERRYAMSEWIFVLSTLWFTT